MKKRYQIIELQVSQHAVGRSIEQMFSIPAATGKLINRPKAGTAERYQITYDALFKRIVGGPLVHADETRANILGKQGYPHRLFSCPSAPMSHLSR